MRSEIRKMVPVSACPSHKSPVVTRSGSFAAIGFLLYRKQHTSFFSLRIAGSFGGSAPLFFVQISGPLPFFGNTYITRGERYNYDEEK